VLGDDADVPGPTRDAFERTSLAHLLAVSGQNVVLLATLVIAVAATLGAGLRARLTAALACVLLYVPLTGAGASIQRAGVMGAAGLVAGLAGRPGSRWYALILAAAATLAWNPYAAQDVGWQLSFAAVLALLVGVPPLRSALRARRIPGVAADAVAVTLAATIGTAPVLAIHFDQVSTVSVPANLLVAPAVAPLMWLGMVAAAVGQVAPALAGPPAELAGGLAGYVRVVAEWMATVPHASITPGPALVAALAVTAPAALIALAVGPERRRSLRRPPRPSRRRLVAGVALAALAVLALRWSGPGSPAPPAPGEVVVAFLDIGQGDATLIRTPDAAILVDTGPPDGPILRRLGEEGVERLDLLVLTHAQADHEGAALDVLRELRPRLVLNGGDGRGTAVQDRLASAAAAVGAQVVPARAGQLLRLGGLRTRILWPPAASASASGGEDPNDRAVVAHVRAGAFDLLLPADAESPVITPLELPRVDALKVAHHGSADEQLDALLDEVRPAVAVVPVGRGNSYGHPAPSTLAALRAVPTVLRTDRDGTVRLRVRDGHVSVEREGPP
jgi:competence protein ComEC